MASESVRRPLDAANKAASKTASSASTSGTSALDRLSQWYSENKLVAWTIVGAAVVGTGAAVYYTSSPRESGPDSKPRKSKRERRKEKAAQETSKPTETSGQFKRASVQKRY